MITYTDRFNREVPITLTRLFDAGMVAGNFQGHVEAGGKHSNGRAARGAAKSKRRKR